MTSHGLFLLVYSISSTLSNKHRALHARNVLTMPSADRRVIGRPICRRPQDGHPAPARDQQQGGGETEEQRDQGRHTGALRQPVLLGAGGRKGETLGTRMCSVETLAPAPASLSISCGDNT